MQSVEGSIARKAVADGDPVFDRRRELAYLGDGVAELLAIEDDRCTRIVKLMGVIGRRTRGFIGTMAMPAVMAAR